MDGAETVLNTDTESQSWIDLGDSITGNESPDKLSSETQAARTGNLNTDKQASPGTTLMTSYLISFTETLQSSKPVRFKLTALHSETTMRHMFWLELSTQIKEIRASVPVFSLHLCRLLGGTNVGTSWSTKWNGRGVCRAQTAGITDVLLHSDKWLFRE